MHALAIHNSYELEQFARRSTFSPINDLHEWISRRPSISSFDVEYQSGQGSIGFGYSTFDASIGNGRPRVRSFPMIMIMICFFLLVDCLISLPTS